MLLGEACMIYGWTAEHCLGMPAIRFFAMLNAGRKIHFKRMIDLCDISSIALGNQKYFEAIRYRFELGYRVLSGTPMKREVQQASPLEDAVTPKLEAGSPEAFNVLHGMFGGEKKRITYPDV